MNMNRIFTFPISFKYSNVTLRQAVNEYFNLGMPSNIDITNWDVSEVIDMSKLFSNRTYFNQPLNWNTSNVQDMNHMFYDCTHFNQPITFYTSQVTNMKHMFSSCTHFNQPITFDTKNVTNMEGMFQKCISFNQPVTFYDTSQVTDMSAMFSLCREFNQPVKFNTKNVTNMIIMFFRCTHFNQPITFSDTSKVLDMRGMFIECTHFNQNLVQWQLHPNVNMTDMFEGATYMLDKNKPTHKLKISGKTINFHKKESIYDAITMDDTVITEYIAETNDNLAIYFINKWTLISRSQIEQLINLKKQDNAIVYECLVPNTMRPENLVKTKSYMNLRSISLYGYVLVSELKMVVNSTHQYFRLEGMKKELNAVVSDAVLNHGSSYISAMHCQEGQEGKVYQILKSYPHIVTNSLNITKKVRSKPLKSVSIINHSKSKSKSKSNINSKSKKIHSI